MSLFPDGSDKIIKFSLIGAIGCLVGAVVGEIPFRMLLPKNEPPQVDVMFVLDVTSSMGEEIEGVRNGILDFSEALSQQGLDSRVGLLAFGDHRVGEPNQLLNFDGSPFTTEHMRFKEEVGNVRQMGGGDAPESSLDGLLEAAKQPFRANAEKVLLLISDAPPHSESVQESDPSVASLSQVRDELREQQVNWLHFVIYQQDEPSYVPLHDVCKGNVFPLSGNRQNFDEVLAQIGQQIADEIAGLNTEGTYGTGALPQLTLATGVWTAFLAIAVSLALIGAQNVYLRRALFSPKEGIIGTVGGLSAGLIGGAVGLLLFVMLGFLGTLLAGIGFLVGWALLGGLVGWGMAFFVPNLRPARVLVLGAVGGAIGALGYVIANSGFGETTGRFLGAAILGFFIGLAAR